MFKTCVMSTPCSGGCYIVLQTHACVHMLVYGEKVKAKAMHRGERCLVLWHGDIVVPSSVMEIRTQVSTCSCVHVSVLYCLKLVPRYAYQVRQRFRFRLVGRVNGEFDHGRRQRLLCLLLQNWCRQKNTSYLLHV